MTSSHPSKAYTSIYKVRTFWSSRLISPTGPLNERKKKKNRAKEREMSHRVISITTLQLYTYVS